MFGMDGYAPGVEFWQGTGEYSPKLDLGKPRNPRDPLVCRLMKATLSRASHPEDFARFGIPEPEVDMKEFYQR